MTQSEAEEDPTSTQLLAAYMSILQKMAAGADERDAVVQELRERADQGDRTAQASLRHPWGTSETPKRATEWLRTALKSTNDALLAQAPGVLSLILEKMIYEGQLEQYSLSQAKPVSSDVYGQLAEAGLSEWMIKRLSDTSKVRLVDLAREASAGPSYYNIISQEDLNSSGLLSRAVPGGKEDGVADCCPIVPTKAFMSLNLGVTPDRWLPSVYWDGVTDSLDFYNFYRTEAAAERHDWDDVQWLPPYRSTREFRDQSKDFAAALDTATLAGDAMEEWLFDDPDSEWGQPSETWDFFPFTQRQCQRWPDLWHAFRPFGEVANALPRFYFEGSAVPERQFPEKLLRIWLFYLLGRETRFSSPAQKRVREILFDFLALPVLTYGPPAYRVLIPRERVKSEAKDR